MLRLRDETRPAHSHAESRPLEAALFRGALPQKAYVDFLAQRRVVHAALEARLNQVVADDTRLAGLVPDELLQTHRLDSDLAHFAIDPQRTTPNDATRSALTEINRLSAAAPIALLGFYYVVEGSKNGARILSRIVERAYRLSDGKGIQYLDPHGERQGKLWADFKDRMNALPLTDAERDAVVDAAKLAFKLLSDIDDAIWTAHI